MKPPATIETARLRLRAPVIEDAEAIFTTYAKDAEVTHYLSFRPHQTTNDTREFLRRCAAGWAADGPFTWIIILREDERLAGAIDVRPQGSRVELGYVLGRAYWGRGFMTEVVGAVGGLGQDIVIECESDVPIVASFMAERTKFPAPGFAGGDDGGLGDVQINGRSIDNRRQHVLKRGDVVLVRTPGGGGYGAAAQRDLALAEHDRALGYL